MSNFIYYQVMNSKRTDEMLTNIQKCSIPNLKSFFEPLDEFTEYVFWIRNRDMGKQIYNSANYQNIWQRDIAVLYEVPLLWLDYLAPDNRYIYMKQFQDRHDKGYLDQTKNAVVYQITTPDKEYRYLFDRCYRCTNTMGEHYIVGISKNISETLWHAYYSNIPYELDEQDKKIYKLFFDILRQSFGITPLNKTQIHACQYNINNDQLAEIYQYALSKREMECLYHFCQGKSYKQTARELAISPRTVETHLENILNKTSCSNKIEIVSRYSHLFMDNKLILENN